MVRRDYDLDPLKNCARSWGRSEFLIAEYNPKWNSANLSLELREPRKAPGWALWEALEVLGGGDPCRSSISNLGTSTLIGGTVKGVQASQPEAKVKEFEKTFRATIQELNVPEILRQGVADRIRILKVSEVTGPSDQAASIIMEIVVTKIILYHVDWFAPHKLAINGSTRLIRATDNMELYSHLFVTTGQEFPFDEWLAEDAAKLRQEVERNCHELAEQIVEEIFFSVRRRKKRRNSMSP